jgi:hypothetical protein
MSSNVKVLFAIGVALMLPKISAAQPGTLLKVAPAATSAKRIYEHTQSLNDRPLSSSSSESQDVNGSLYLQLPKARTEIHTNTDDGEVKQVGCRRTYGSGIRAATDTNCSERAQ